MIDQLQRERRRKREECQPDPNDPNPNNNNSPARPLIETAQMAAVQLAFAREYLEIADVFKPRDEVATIKSHTFKFL